MKTCTKCQLAKPITDFHKGNGAHGVVSRCKPCVKEWAQQNKSVINAASERWRQHNPEYMPQYREANADRIKQLNKQYALDQSEERADRTRQWIKDNPERKKKLDTEYYQQNRDKMLAQMREAHEANPEVGRQRAKQWRKENPGRVAHNIAIARARRMQAIPPWVTKQEKSAIKRLYEQCQQITEQTGIPHQVDHIYPLVSDIVCGLHCLANLQILTATENNKKKCKLITPNECSSIAQKDCA